MSVFGSIMGKIFGHKEAAAAPAAAGSPGQEQVMAGSMPAAPAPGAGAPPAMPVAPTSPAVSATPVDVGAVLAEMASKAGQPLNYKTSIVDLMKLLGLDSSIENRNALATELSYTGDMNDSASMNIWLHKQVMTKLSENGGKVPAELMG